MGNQGADIVKAIVEMAHSLKLRVIAEGVETEERTSRLRRLGCNYLQGFLISRPVSADIVEEIPQGDDMVVTVQQDAIQ